MRAAAWGTPVRSRFCTFRLRGRAASNEGAPYQSIEFFRMLLFGHHAAVVEDFQARVRIELQESGGVFNRRRHVLLSPNKNAGLRQTPESRTHVCIQITGKESRDRVLRARLVTGGVKVGHQPVSHAPMIVKDLFAPVVTNAAFTSHDVVEGRAQNRRLQQAIKRSASERRLVSKPVNAGRSIEDEIANQFGVLIRDPDSKGRAQGTGNHVYRIISYFANKVGDKFDVEIRGIWS